MDVQVTMLMLTLHRLLMLVQHRPLNKNEWYLKLIPTKRLVENNFSLSINRLILLFHRVHWLISSIKFQLNVIQSDFVHLKRIRTNLIWKFMIEFDTYPVVLHYTLILLYEHFVEQMVQDHWIIQLNVEWHYKLTLLDDQ